MFPEQQKEEFVSVWVRDPRIQKEDFWHSYIDYEICIHTNSMCFTMKTSCVRRRYREFVWLRQRLQNNALLVQLPELPSKNLFFNMNNRQHVDQRRQGLEDFLRKVLQNALLLSDSCLHLFLQSHLNSEDIEACVSGQTKYSVEDAIHKFALMNRRFPEEDEEGKKENDIDYDSERQYCWDVSAEELPYWNDCCPHFPLRNEELTVQVQPSASYNISYDTEGEF
uniref:Sorting nexin 10 n=1 Tax=Canis lupus familiaris TaxID=9615 RepID=A0A8C0S1Q8_CANLF